ncbi:MAG: hypothetical protein EX269_15140 [Acidimicrobiales bacterium]|nr:MAG: hypothetical protein EX269_15140 [Acidimicrobiales bacterium]
MNASRWIRAILVMSVLAAVIVALHYAARFDLGGPAGMDDVNDWLNDPVLVVATIARWLALIMSYYLLVIVAATATAETGTGRRWISRIIPERSAALAGLLLGIAAVAVPLADNAHTTTSKATDATAAAPLTLVRASDSLQLQPVDSPRRAQDSVRPIPEPPATTFTPISDDADIWDVASGENFWLIASETLEEHLGRDDLEDAEIAVYWRQLIAANEDRLIEPGNPDLLLPGQQLVIPDPKT